jgi:hypothetical protein
VCFRQIYLRIPAVNKHLVASLSRSLESANMQITQLELLLRIDARAASRAFLKLD